MHTREFVRTTHSRCVAEIGVGHGETSAVLAEHTADDGELHLFDYADRVDPVVQRLHTQGHTHVVG